MDQNLTGLLSSHILEQADSRSQIHTHSRCVYALPSGSGSVSSKNWIVETPITSLGLNPAHMASIALRSAPHHGQYLFHILERLLLGMSVALDLPAQYLASMSTWSFCWIATIDNAFEGLAWAYRPRKRYGCRYVVQMGHLPPRSTRRLSTAEAGILILPYHFKDGVCCNSSTTCVSMA